MWVWVEIQWKGRGAHRIVIIIQKGNRFANETSVLLYTNHGFERVRNEEVKPYKEEYLKSEEWKEVDEELVEVLTGMGRVCRRG
ncbi:uncharacterized protein EAF01_005860 [Botrytis porri]|uniref:Uncharacterized protein n=1 Tax=Botrytis porri TaxID=87229 RepID=A0A4Z1L4T2_9HELO|nr:uncharacterized protein EAF01_005860 [Botrytis porri]KAF7905339.1 hypothetical protein EAF01_005860 [Botrytis porri]TGO91834.1 hypothetical protein BPOR_0017g00160 [Botrytis porri]